MRLATLESHKKRDRGALNCQSTRHEEELVLLEPGQKSKLQIDAEGKKTAARSDPSGVKWQLKIHFTASTPPQNCISKCLHLALLAPTSSTTCHKPYINIYICIYMNRSCKNQQVKYLNNDLLPGNILYQSHVKH